MYYRHAPNVRQIVIIDMLASVHAPDRESTLQLCHGHRRCCALARSMLRRRRAGCTLPRRNRARLPACGRRLPARTPVRRGQAPSWIGATTARSAPAPCARPTAASACASAGRPTAELAELVLVFGIAGCAKANRRATCRSTSRVIREGAGEFFSTQGDDKCMLDHGDAGSHRRHPAPLALVPDRRPAASAPSRRAPCAARARCCCRASTTPGASTSKPKTRKQDDILTAGKQ